MAGVKSTPIKEGQQYFEYRTYRCMTQSGHDTCRGYWGIAEVFLPYDHPCYGKPSQQLQMLTDKLGSFEKALGQIGLSHARKNIEADGSSRWRIGIYVTESQNVVKPYTGRLVRWACLIVDSIEERFTNNLRPKTAIRMISPMIIAEEKKKGGEKKRALASGGPAN